MKHANRKPTRAERTAPPQVAYCCTECDTRFASKYEAKQHSHRTGHYVREYKA